MEYDDKALKGFKDLKTAFALFMLSLVLSLVIGFFVTLLPLLLFLVVMIVIFIIQFLALILITLAIGSLAQSKLGHVKAYKSAYFWLKIVWIFDIVYLVVSVLVPLLGEIMSIISLIVILIGFVEYIITLKNLSDDTGLPGFWFGGIALIMGILIGIALVVAVTQGLTDAILNPGALSGEGLSIAQMLSPLLIFFLVLIVVVFVSVYLCYSAADSAMATLYDAPSQKMDDPPGMIKY